MHLEHPLGCEEKPMSDADMRCKFHDCASRARSPYPPERIDTICETISRLEMLEDVNELFSLL